MYLKLIQKKPRRNHQEFSHNGRLTFGQTAGALDVATTAAAVLPKSVLPSSDEPPWDHGQFCKSAHVWIKTPSI
jgi:hypothetical protein